MFEIMTEEMKLKNFSSKTQEVYLLYNRKFLEFIRKSPRDISHKDIRAFLLSLIEKRYSTSAVNLAHNALNFYYGKILHKAVKSIPFQKREQKIFEVLSKAQIHSLIEINTNPKHRLLVELLYASGVRVSEAVRIKIEHLDLERKMLLVQQGKGRKDRYTLLSSKVLANIQEYLKARKNPSTYLFENSRGGHLTAKAVESVLDNSAQKAGIGRKVHPHLLRHSFATHLLESGVRESHIQQLLGHKDIRTTLAYAHITNKHLLGIQSPDE